MPTLTPCSRVSRAVAHFFRWRDFFLFLPFPSFALMYQLFAIKWSTCCFQFHGISYLITWSKWIDFDWLILKSDKPWSLWYGPCSKRDKSYPCHIHWVHNCIMHFIFKVTPKSLWIQPLLSLCYSRIVELRYLNWYVTMHTKSYECAILCIGCKWV